MSRLSLNAHDRQALARIEEELGGGDPKFAARLSAFSRLADGEAMPERERISEARQPVIGRALCGLRPGRPGARKLMYWAAVAMAISITLAVISFALVSGHSGTKGACTGWQGGACARQAAPSAPAPSGQEGHAPFLAP